MDTAAVQFCKRERLPNFQIDKLVRAGADILAPVLIGPKRLQGTAVDYSYHMYNLVGCHFSVNSFITYSPSYVFI